ncbi:MAG: amidohydrolase family protein [Emergencia sp.]
MTTKEKYLYIKGQKLVTMNSSDDIIDHGVVVVKDNIIDFVGTEREAEKKYAPDECEFLKYENGLILPGLVTSHTHLFQSLMKGIGTTLNLDDWVTKVIYPMSMAMDKNDCYNAGRLNMAEMIRTGTTCFADSHYIVQKDENFDGMAEAVRATGIRAILCRATQNMKYHPDVPTEAIEDDETALRKTEMCIKKYHNTENGRLRIGVEPITPIDCTETTIKGLFALAEKYDTLFQCHAAESFGELTTIKNTKNQGIMEYLNSLGVLSARTMIIHCIWISAMEQQLLSDTQTKVSHQPLANMILADGIAPIPELISRGVTIGMGVDGAASNNNQDLFECMKAAALLHRVNTLDAGVLSAYDVLKMSTMGSAKCIGLDQEIGSLEVGKKADIIVVDNHSLHLTPAIDPIANIVFSGNGRDVDTTIIDGRILMKDKKLVCLDEQEVVDLANISAAKMYQNISNDIKERS